MNDSGTLLRITDRSFTCLHLLVTDARGKSAVMKRICNMKTRKNYYYLVAGIIFLVSAVTHALNGKLTLLAEMGTTSLEVSSQTIIRYVWHIITAENLIFGVALLLMAFAKDQVKIRFTVWLIATVLLTRWLVILLFTLAYDPSVFIGSLIDGVVIILLVVVLLLGNKAGRKWIPASPGYGAR